MFNTTFNHISVITSTWWSEFYLLNDVNWYQNFNVFTKKKFKFECSCLQFAPLDELFVSKENFHVLFWKNDSEGQNFMGLSWSWSYGSWTYNYLCNQLLSPLKLWVLIRSWRDRCTRYNIIWLRCQWLVTGRWFFPSSLVSSTNKTDCYNIAKILSKVTLNTLTPAKNFTFINISSKYDLSFPWLSLKNLSWH